MQKLETTDVIDYVEKMIEKVEFLSKKKPNAPSSSKFKTMAK